MKIDLSGNAPLLLGQLEQIVAAEPPSAAIRSIYFGLFERSDEASDLPRPTLYVSGSTRSADDPDWTCWDEDSWLPKDRYFSLARLGEADLSQWEWIQEAVAELLRTNQVYIAGLLGSSKGRPVALGWDDGEPQVLYIAKR